MSSSGNPLELSSWGLPPEVLRRYNELGITHMFEWQADCLRTGKVLTGGKLVSPVVTVELSRLFGGNLSETAGGGGSTCRYFKSYTSWGSGAYPVGVRTCIKETKWTF